MHTARLTKITHLVALVILVQIGLGLLFSETFSSHSETLGKPQNNFTDMGNMRIKSSFSSLRRRHNKFVSDKMNVIHPHFVLIN